MNWVELRFGEAENCLGIFPGRWFDSLQEGQKGFCFYFIPTAVFALQLGVLHEAEEGNRGCFMGILDQMYNILRCECK